MRYAVLPLVLTLSIAGSSFAQPNSARPAADSNQSQAAANKPSPDASDRRHSDWPTRTFYLKYATTANDINELATALRQLLPYPDQTFVIASQFAIVMHAPPDDLALAEKLLGDLDIPKKSWRLTYTLTEVDGGKRLGSQHYSMVAVDGQESTLKQGDRVPITTGAFSSKDQANQTNIAYQDVGMTFDARLDEIHDGAGLRYEVAETGVADDKAMTGMQDPVFRQNTLKGQATLTSGKPLILGSMDIPGSTRHLEIEVLMEPLP